MSAEDNVKGEVITMSRADSQVLPINVIEGGEYISAHSGKFIVKLKGLFRVGKNGQTIFEGTLKESDIIFSRFVYIGTVYPDKTSVPFIPVANVGISKVDSASEYDSFGSLVRESVGRCHKVHISLPSESWAILFSKVQHSVADFHVHTKGVTQNYSNSKEINIKCELEKEDVVRVCLNGMWFEKSIREALQVAKPLRGNVFLMPKFTRTPSSCTGVLSFGIFGIWVTEDIDKIFGPFHWQKVIM